MREVDRWRRIEQLFHTAVELDGPERLRYLLESCGDDARLRKDVEALLEAERRSGVGTFITGAIAAAAGELAAESSASWVGRDVGPYRLLRELARGGMGTVYLAERADAAYEAQVAIKFVRGAVAGSELVRRFLAERQILADLAHPNIARLLDGGATDDGTPYLVMERIEGEPIDAYCDRRALGVPERLQLFCRVCDAVHHAHRHLVVHRDIKPSNILVTADGAPKLLDFGVAKLMDPSQAHPMLDTGVGAQLLTPAYASPEQVRAEPITTATDVYSLGVLLYKLLSGTLPYDAGTLKDHQLAEAILTREPEAPSRVARRVGRDASGLERDVDAMVLTALNKEPSRRYASAERFAADVRRYLGGQPVQARPQTGAYRFRKFIRRHRAGVFAGTSIALLVVGLTAFYVLRLRRERDLATTEQRKSTQVTQFLEGLFKVSDPSEARGRTVTAREVVDSAVKRLPTALAGQPEVEAAMLYTLAGLYLNLGLGHEALPLVERGLRLRRTDPSRGSPTVGDFLARLGETQIDLGQVDSAAASLGEGARLLDAEYDTPDRAMRARVELANAYRLAGRVAQADTILTRALVDTTQAADDSELAFAVSSRAALFLSERQAVAAEPFAREAVRRYRERLGADAPATMTAMNNLGQVLYQQSRFAEAEPIMREVLAIRERVYGDRHPETALAWNNLAALLQAEGRYNEAVDAGRHALTIYRATYGDRHQRVTLAMANLASMLLAAGQPTEAERLDRAALQIDLAILPPGHINIAVLHNNLAHLLEEHGRHYEAEQSYRKALEVIRQGMGVKTPTGSIFLANLGGVLQEEGRLRDADTTLRRALAIQREVLPAQHASTATTLTALGALLVRMHRSDAAEPLLREALTMRTALLPPDHWAIQVTRSALGACLADLGDGTEAESLLTTSAETLRKRFGPADARARDAIQRTVRFYSAQGDTAQATVFRSLLQPSP
jgi:serine/threonine protein kinase/tetratricopeptide (TPR) repeat protein